VTGHHLIERGRGVFHHLGRGLVEGPGELLDRRTEASGLADLISNEPGDLVAPARELELLALERKSPLARDERAEGRVCGPAAGDLDEALAQLVEPRRGPDHQLRASRVGVQDPPLVANARPARIDKRQQVDHGPAAHSVALRRQPCEAYGRDQRIVGVGGQARR
jgi:hypothetical protein